MELRKVLLTSIIVLSVILAAELLLNIVIAPRLQIRVVELDSDLAISDENLYILTGLDKNSIFYSINEEEMENRVLRLAQIKEVAVTKQFPDKIKIKIRRREPLGMILLKENEVVKPALFDESGRIFQVGSGFSSWNLPIFNGIDVAGKVEAGDRLPGELVWLLSDLDRLKKENNQLYQLISEVEILPVRSGGFDYRLYFTSAPNVSVLAMGSLDKERVEEMLLVVDVLRKEDDSSISEIDFRSGNIVYRKGGEV